MARVYKKINGRWIQDEGPTQYVQDEDTGFMMGRLGTGEKLTKAEKEKNWSAHKDNTKVRRVIKPFTKVRASDGRRGTTRHYGLGQIIGRLTSK